VGRKPVYLLSKLALAATAYPAFAAINHLHTLGALLMMTAPRRFCWSRKPRTLRSRTEVPPRAAARACR
jgi:hypothetical protein